MSETKAPKIVNRSGTLKMTDETASKKPVRDISGKKLDRRNRRDRVRADVAPKEFDEITISVDRVSRTVAGGRRMRFKALVAIGNHKNKVGVGVAKGNDVTTAVAKATAKAKKSLITFAMDGETICHEVETRVTGADVLMKPAAPGTGIIAGGTVRSIMGLTGVKNLISKSLGSANKVNIAYAVIEGLKQQVPRKDWLRPGAQTASSKTMPGAGDAAGGTPKASASERLGETAATGPALATKTATKKATKTAPKKTTKKEAK